MNVILSIQPSFCQLIFDRQKRFEYRKRVFKGLNVDKVYIYASRPICKIVGYFTIGNIIEDTPSMVWDMTHKQGGITKKQFNDYFKGRDIAHAIKIEDVTELVTPLDPKAIIKDFTAPQNFIYTDLELDRVWHSTDT